jgi:hypothetical protein
MFVIVDDPTEAIAPADVEGGDRVWIGDRGGQRVQGPGVVARRSA